MSSAPRATVVSAPLRFEDRSLLTGTAQFVDDIAKEGVLHLAFHRTDLPHARITSVDTSEAAELEGIHSVWTGADLGPSTDLIPRLETPDGETYSPPRPLLARDHVLFVGEAVAAVLADSRYLAEDGAEMVWAEYEELPIARDADHALDTDAPLLHPTRDNVLYDRAMESANVDAAFETAAVVVERTFDVGRYSAAPMECRAVLAAPDRDGGVEIWTSTQAPHSVQSAIARVLGLEPDRVTVHCPWVGGGFGQKAHVYPEEILVPLLALRTRRPVKWIEDRRENLLASSHARGQRVRVRLAAEADGTMTAVDADVLCDMGAYGVYPHGHLLEAVGTPLFLTGPYRIPDVRVRVRVVATNKCPGGAFRGVGLAVSAFVHERLVEILARELERPAVELRRQNLISSDELPWTSAIGLVYDSGDYRAALDGALARIDHGDLADLRNHAESRGKLLGIGHGIYVESTGIGSSVFQGRGMVDIPGWDQTRVVIENDGSATVYTSLPSAGQGLLTTFAQLVATELYLPVQAVRVEMVNTRQGVRGTGTFASRSAIVGGAAIADAGNTLRERLLNLASNELEAHVADLEFVEGGVRVVGSPNTTIGFADLAAAAEPGYLDVIAEFDPPGAAIAYGAHACIVEVDPGLGSVEILRYAVVEDCGEIINQQVIEGQTHGASAQGISAAVLEEVLYSDGQPVSSTMMDYLLPTATEIPPFDIGHLKFAPLDLPRKFKGVGEGGVIGGGLCVANAISDAIGAEVNKIPASPREIVALRHRAQREVAT